jgi:hypothetical protein
MNDELEFATKEDLEAIEKSPELKKVYNAMKAGVTKKFQEWAEKRKELENTAKELENRIYEWEDWYASAFPEGWQSQEQLTQPTQPTQSSQLTQSRNEPTIAELIDAINKAGAVFERRLNDLASQQQRLSNAFTLSLDLIEQKFQNPQMDIVKVLETARDKGLGDLKTAYDIAYRDELLNKQVEERVKKALEEKEAERRKTLETGSGTVPLTLERPKEAPKSFTEATQQFLKERAVEGAK